MADRRSTQDVLVCEKTAKIKDWVNGRLKELEAQNRALRVQNLKCNQQLELLASAARRSSLLLSTSAHASLMSRSMVNTTTSKRGSDDSGTTSDAPPDGYSPHGHLEWPRIAEQARATVLSSSTHTSLPRDTTPFGLASITPTHSLPRDSIHDGSPRRLEKGSPRHSPRRRPSDRKPVPKPRKKDSQVEGDERLCGPVHHSHHVVLRSELLIMDRDSLDFTLEEDDDVTESLCNLLVCRDSLREDDYVNLKDIQDQVLNRWAMWVFLEEKQLHQLADQCLLGKSSPQRDSMFSAAETSGSRSARTSDGSYPRDSPGFAPLYTTRHSDGGTKKLKSKLSWREDSGGGEWSGETSSGPRSSAASSDRHQPPPAESSSEEDYAVPPDAEEASPVEILGEDDFAEEHKIEMSGYLNVASNPESRMKTWKRRWFVLRDLQLHIYKSKADEGKSALCSLVLLETRVSGRQSEKGKAFELAWPKGKQLLSADTPATTQQWLKSLEEGCKAAREAEIRSKLGDDGACILKGWISRVKVGRTRLLYARLVSTSIVFFKAATSKVALSQESVLGSEVCEVSRLSDDSSSDDPANPYASPQTKTKDYSISIQRVDQEPLYLVFASNEDKEKWLYHLKLAAKDGELEGTGFEKLTQKLMAVNGNPDSSLWSDALLSEGAPLSAPLCTLAEGHGKEAVEMYKSALLFSEVPMQGSALQYHIDLAQGLLNKALAVPQLQDELVCQLIRLSNAGVGGAQSWQLLALTLPLFLPRSYTALSLLRYHLARWSLSKGSGKGRLAFYCSRALERCTKLGARKEGPSRMEALSLLTKDPSDHDKPHSIPVALPDSSYHIVAFDGSSGVQEVCVELCGALGLRHPLYSGLSLFADHPLQLDFPMPLNPKHKICDVISRWERELREGKCGRIPTGRLIRLSLRERFHWPHLLAGETEKEKLYRGYRIGEEVRAGRVPASPELTEHICALLAQMTLANLNPDSLDDVINRFYPEHLLQVACRPTLKGKLNRLWGSLSGQGPLECAGSLMGVVKRWGAWGSTLYPARLRWRNEDPVWLAVRCDGIRILSHCANMEEQAHYPYSSLLQFGGCRGDFQLTLSREGGSEGPGRERLTFGMAKTDLLQITMLIADYIKVRRLVCGPSGHRKKVLSGATPRHSPRK